MNFAVNPLTGGVIGNFDPPSDVPQAKEHNGKGNQKFSSINI